MNWIIILLAVFIIGVLVAYYFDYKRDPKYFISALKAAFIGIITRIFIGTLGDND